MKTTLKVERISFQNSSLCSQNKTNNSQRLRRSWRSLSSLFSAWAPAGGFGLMATAGTSMWPVCLHAHISAFVLLHCGMALGDNENIPFCLRIVSQFGNRSDLLFVEISLASSVLLRTSLPSRAVPPAAALQTSSNPRAPLAACLASLMCHAYQLIPYCSGPFPMQGLQCC